MNALLEHIIKERKGHYCHALEVSDTYELECITESLIDAYSPEFTEYQIIEFLESASLFYLGEDEDEEQAIYDFSFTEYIKDTI